MVKNTFKKRKKKLDIPNFITLFAVPGSLYDIVHIKLIYGQLIMVSSPEGGGGQPNDDEMM